MKDERLPGQGAHATTNATASIVAARYRARQEYPHARAQVRAMYAARRWHFYWKRRCDDYDPEAIARAAASMERAMRAA